jgi:hypothetical protein
VNLVSAFHNFSGDLNIRGHAATGPKTWPACPSTSDNVRSPSYDQFCLAEGIPEFFLGYRFAQARVSGLPGIGGKQGSIRYFYRDDNTLISQSGDQLVQVVGITKTLAEMLVLGLKGFFCCLLGMEAKIFIECPFG